MRYDHLITFEKYLEETATERLSLLYFILGKDTFECQEAIELLLSFLLPSEQMRQLALTIFEGHQVEEEVLGQALSSVSFFTKSQFIWIQQAEKLKKSVQEALEKYFHRPQPNLYVILSATTWQKNTSFYRALDKKGIILELAEMKPWEKEKHLVEWLSKRVAAERKLMSYQVCQALIKRIGNDRALLGQEIEKLLCYCYDKKEITLQDIELLCEQQQIESIWQLGEAIFRRDTSSALQMSQMFLTESYPLLPLLRQIRSQFQTEYQVCLLLAQGKQAQDISQAFPYMKGQILERHIQQARQYGLEAFKKGLLAIDEAELRAKNSSIEEKFLLELLMIRLTHSLT